MKLIEKLTPGRLLPKPKTGDGQHNQKQRGNRKDCIESERRSKPHSAVLTPSRDGFFQQMRECLESKDWRRRRTIMSSMMSGVAHGFLSSRTSSTLTGLSNLGTKARMKALRNKVAVAVQMPTSVCSNEPEIGILVAS